VKRGAWEDLQAHVSDKRGGATKFHKHATLKGDTFFLESLSEDLTLVGIVAR
jgi:hypothetical protein